MYVMLSRNFKKSIKEEINSIEKLFRMFGFLLLKDPICSVTSVTANDSPDLSELDRVIALAIIRTESHVEYCHQ